MSLDDIQQEFKKEATLDWNNLHLADNYYADLEPKVSISKKKSEGVDSIFDIVIDPMAELDQSKGYYIKQKYYTPKNLEAGKNFFELNCAVCHGAEGDGSGIRASIMTVSKPRMFTNLDWIKTRDDLRLLRSIKYGVPGTSMTPWGDLTSSLQRLQLVMFIRSLTVDKDMREMLAEYLYKTFDSSF